MKRFSAREFVLLCSPLLIVGVVGWLLSKRKPPAPVTPLHLAFHIEAPTVLEAFSGSNAALVVELTGKNADKMRVYSANSELQLNTKNGIEKSDGASAGPFWNNVWKGNVNNTRFLIDSKAIPGGQLTFNVNTNVVPSAGRATTFPIRGTWKVDRTQIQPYAFSSLQKSPQMMLRSVTLTTVPTSKNPSFGGDAVFALTGSSVGSKTPVVFSFSNSDGGMGWSSSGATDTPTTRTINWTAYASSYRPNQKRMVLVTGRVSANHRWPLAFEFQPFDLTRVKVDQSLKFKSWPAPVPAMSK